SAVNGEGAGPATVQPLAVVVCEDKTAAMIASAARVESKSRLSLFPCRPDLPAFRGAFGEFFRRPRRDDGNERRSHQQQPTRVNGFHRRAPAGTNLSNNCRQPLGGPSMYSIRQI